MVWLASELVWVMDWSGFLSGLAAGVLLLFLVWYGFQFDLASCLVWLLVWSRF